MPSDFSQFSLDGLKPYLAQGRPQIGGTLFDELESGAVLTRWLGEGDFCAGNFFNPAGGPVKIRLVGLTLPGGGKNPNPPTGFHYGHYTTATTVGLNKDEPPGPDPQKNEPSYANHVVARDAALRVSVLLWRSFLDSIGKACREGDAACAAPGELDVWGGSWEVTIESVEWTPGQATACCLDLRRIGEAEGRPLVGQPFGDRTFGPCPEATVFYTGTIGFGLGGQVLACTDGSYLTGVFRATPAPLPQQYTPLQESASLRMFSQTGAFIGTWTPRVLSLNWRGRCVSGPCLP